MSKPPAFSEHFSNIKVFNFPLSWDNFIRILRLKRPAAPLLSKPKSLSARKWNTFSYLWLYDLLPSQKSAWNAWWPPPKKYRDLQDEFIKNSNTPHPQKRCILLMIKQISHWYFFVFPSYSAPWETNCLSVSLQMPFFHRGLPLGAL